MKCLLVKYSSEITLKGLNRNEFVEVLLREVRRKLGNDFRIEKEPRRI